MTTPREALAAAFVATLASIVAINAPAPPPPVAPLVCSEFRKTPIIRKDRGVIGTRVECSAYAREAS